MQHGGNLCKAFSSRWDGIQRGWRQKGGFPGAKSRWEQKESEVHKINSSTSTLEVYKQKIYNIFVEEMDEKFPILG